ncbi:allophanate hydrolase [Burkholderia mayonis]|uniref:Allophanate hydrolase n=1 Tax=Burkholderia mayonis TaxID=1385591 RepID=A0A1B4FHP4_9BURK|nr:biotin-dependent carboxyltransferase family protein [Burkholderia mayonis]AOJ03204.1 allophanate hydrolase [Burkholderia mayonis]KVE45377.1 allophanate hydrolase [Burkholderia mayonis]
MTSRQATGGIEVLRAGPLSTIQDLGRRGYRHLGVAQSGALDSLALEVGNRLVGNRPDAAAIEITLGPATFRFPRATRIAITGTEFGATLDGVPIYSWWSVPVAAGETLTLPVAKRGMRGYLCVAGGLDVLPMLGSRSTDLASRFGGLGGRVLRDGDRLPVGTPPAGAPACVAPDAPEFGVKAPAWCAFARVDEQPRRHKHTHAAWAMPVRVLPGPQYASFTPASQQTFWDEEWIVTPSSNRMGYRLSGAKLERAEPGDMLSHAVLPGTIQVPGNGQPIVLMNDAQTTGGYPRIGAVIRADLWKLAQARLNLPIRFVRVTVAAARDALAAERAYLRQIDIAIEMREEALQRALAARGVAA